MQASDVLSRIGGKKTNRDKIPSTEAEGTWNVSEEDGVDEEGRPMDKPLTMAAPSSDGDADRDTPAGVMAPRAKTASRTRSDEQSSSSAEDIAGTSSQDESVAAGSSPDASADFFSGGRTPSAWGLSDGGSAGEDASSAAPNGSRPSFGKPVAPLPADVISSDGRSKDGSGQNGERLPTVISARQAVRQAVAATNSWFTGRAAKVADAQSAASVPTGPDPTIPSTAAASAQAAQPVAPTAPPRTAARPPQYSPPGSKGFTATAATATARRSKAPRRAPRQAQLTVARVEPWSVMKFSAVVSVAAFIVIFVAVAVLYAVLSSLGVFDSLQHLVNTVTSSKGNGGTNIRGWFSAARILSYTALLGSVNIVLITAMATIGAVIYNLISRTIGGIEVTLRETD
jgi:hypothetical protein